VPSKQLSGIEKIAEFSRSPRVQYIPPHHGLFRDLPAVAILCTTPGYFFIEIQRVTVSNTESSDTHFFNSFSLVLGILILFAIILFGVARSIGADTQAREVLLDPLHLKGVQQNIEPFAHLAIAGKDNSALAVVTAPAEGLFCVPLDRRQRRAENRRSCGMGPARRGGQGCVVQSCDRRQGQYAAQGWNDLAGCDDSHDGRLHGVAQQISIAARLNDMH